MFIYTYKKDENQKKAEQNLLCDTEKLLTDMEHALLNI
jgi:transcription-repair coupling factor (superfamily II helicase)